MVLRWSEKLFPAVCVVKLAQSTHTQICRNMAKLLATKRALICLLFLGFLLVALYSFLLDWKTTSVHLEDRTLHSESGRLVARSQLNFHHIVEQWIQPDGRSNHNTRRKERLIEDSRVIKEAFDYGESENKRVDDFQQSKLNFHLSQLANISSGHKNNLAKEQQLHQEYKNGSSSSLVPAKQHWLQPDDVKQSQHPLLQNHHSESVKRVEGDPETEVNSQKLDTQNVEFANLQVQRSNDHSGTGSKHANVKTDHRNPRELVPVRSDHESDGKAALDAQTKSGVLSEKPGFQSKDAAVNIQPKLGGGKLSASKVTSSRQARVNARPSSELESDRGGQGSEQNSTRHRQLSDLKRDIHKEIPLVLPDSGQKTKSGVAKQAPIKTSHDSNNAVSAKSGQLPSDPLKVRPDHTPSKENYKTAVNKHVTSLNSKAKPAMTSKNASKVYRPPPKPQTKMKSADSSTFIVTYVNSKGRTVRVVKHKNVALPNTSSTQQKKDGTVKQVDNKEVNTGGSSVSSRSTNPLDREDFDFDSDPRYAHLPPTVKKKLAEIRKNRLNRIKFIRLIRKRCEGRKYCVQHVRMHERALHDNCFYDAIMAEEKDGIQLNPCQCSLTYTTGRGPVSHVSQGVVSSSVVYKAGPLVALVSLPGSGNTWVRGLLEEATGYCTGSMWCDPVLRAKQFCAEGVRANTLVVKNHDAKIRWLDEKLPVNTTNFTKPSFSSAIFVHRDPYEATIAEWNRALGYKVYNATKHNLTVAGIGYYNSTAVKDQHTVTFGKEAFGE